MVVIGLLLILAGACAAVFALLGGGDPASLSWHGLTVATTALGVFGAGALTVLTLEVGLAAIGRGSKRGVSRRRELRRLRREMAAHDAAGADAATRVKADRSAGAGDAEHPDAATTAAE